MLTGRTRVIVVVCLAIGIVVGVVLRITLRQPEVASQPSTPTATNVASPPTHTPSAPPSPAVKVTPCAGETGFARRACSFEAAYQIFNSSERHKAVRPYVTQAYLKRLPPTGIKDSSLTATIVNPLVYTDREGETMFVSVIYTLVTKRGDTTVNTLYNQRHNTTWIKQDGVWRVWGDTGTQ